MSDYRAFMSMTKDDFAFSLSVMGRQWMIENFNVTIQELNNRARFLGVAV